MESPTPAPSFAALPLPGVPLFPGGLPRFRTRSRCPRQLPVLAAPVLHGAGGRTERLRTALRVPLPAAAATGQDAPDPRRPPAARPGEHRPRYRGCDRSRGVTPARGHRDGLWRPPGVPAHPRSAARGRCRSPTEPGDPRCSPLGAAGTGTGLSLVICRCRGYRRGAPRYRGYPNIHPGADIGMPIRARQGQERLPRASVSPWGILKGKRNKRPAGRGRVLVWGVPDGAGVDPGVCTAVTVPAVARVAPVVPGPRGGLWTRTGRCSRDSAWRGQRLRSPQKFLGAAGGGAVQGPPGAGDRGTPATR